MKFTLSAAATALAAAMLAPPAAASIKYDFSASGMGVSSGSTVTGATVGALPSGDPGPDVTIRGIRGTGGGSLGYAPVKTWNGLGVAGDGGSPEHSTDNSGSYEAIALQFAASIALTEVSIGWYSNDSDLSVLAYTGAGTPTVGGTWAGLTGPGGGWTLLGHYANVHNQPSDTTSLRNDAVTRGTPISSSYWLIAAYNPLVGSGPRFNGGGLGTGALDFMKIDGVGGFTPRTDVPEPAVWTLVAAGLLGMAAKRRAVKRAGTA